MKNGGRTRCLASMHAMLIAAALLAQPELARAGVKIYPAPDGEPLSAQFKVFADQGNVPVYVATVCSLSPEERKSLGGAPVQQSTTKTSFASFDMEGEVRVSVTCDSDVKSVSVLPSRLGIKPQVAGKTISFTLDKPGQLTIDVNGDWMHSLQVFANPMETNIPDPKDPNVIYFAPGIHHVQSVPVGSSQTVYVASGAIVYGEVEQKETGHSLPPIFVLKGSNVSLRGRGIIDGSLCPFHSRSILGVMDSSDVRVEGVVLRDSSQFTLPVRRSDRVKIGNVKIFGWRGNSDGMDLCNSRDVEVADSFVRTFDDLIVLKTDKNQGELRNVTVRNCTLWNEFAHALSLGAELREPASDVFFSDCDVVHDKGREWLLRIYNCDSATVKNVVFDNIRIDEARKLMSVWIGNAVWSKEPERGQVDGVAFKDIQSVTPVAPEPYADLAGYDAAHAVRNVRFENVTVGGLPLQENEIRENAFVSGVSIGR